MSRTHFGWPQVSNVNPALIVRFSQATTFYLVKSIIADADDNWRIQAEHSITGITELLRQFVDIQIHFRLDQAS